MKQKTPGRKKRLLLYIGIPLLVIVVLVIVALSGVNSFLKPVIKKALANIVVNGSDSLYTFSLKDYQIGPGARSAVISGLDIHVDSSRYRLLKTAGLLPELIFSVQVEKASVSGLHPWDLWFHKNIICKGVTLDGAKVNLLQQEKKSDTAKADSSKPLYELIKPGINDINIRRITIANADVIYKTVQQQTEENQSFQFKNSNIILDDIVVDSVSLHDSTRVWYAGNLRASLGSSSMNSSDGMYRFSVKSTDYDFKKRAAEIKDFKITPAISQAEFNRRMGHEADKITISIPGISIEEFNGGAILSESNIEAGLLKLTEPDIELYKDKTAGPDTRNKVGKYPHQLLLKADMDIRIKQLDVSKGRLTVTQKSAKTLEKGSFQFYNVHGNIKNITNFPGDIEVNKWCRADLAAGFMGNNTMQAIFNFDLASDNGHFETDASLTSLPPKDINPTFRALARAEMESFSLDKLSYHVVGYDHYAVGDLTLRYHDLKLNVLKEGDDGEMKKKGLISLLANVLKLYNSNPMPGDEERKANNIREQRPTNKNYFGLIVKTLLTCAQEIAVKGKNKSLPGMGGGKKKDK